MHIHTLDRGIGNTSIEVTSKVSTAQIFGCMCVCAPLDEAAVNITPCVQKVNATLARTDAARNRCEEEASEQRTKRESDTTGKRE